MRTTLFAGSLLLASLGSHGQSTGEVPATGSDPTAGEIAAAEMSPAELAAVIGSPNVFIYDCNEEDMYAEAHVPGARLIVYDEVTADKLPPDRNATLVFYCYSPECPASRTAARSAAGSGYAHVFFMLEGITGWQDAGLKTDP